MNKNEYVVDINDITKEQFMAYDAVREDGYTNMFDIPKVIEYAEILYDVPLTREEVTAIMKNYSKLREKFYGVTN